MTISLTDPFTDGVQSGLTTSTEYDLVGRAWRITQPDDTYVTNLFDLMGQVTNTSGSRTYPVGYTFDYAGRMATMTTWTNYASAQGAATTTWNYDSQRGWLTNKTFNDGNGPGYTYTPAGRLATRTWARGITTAYGYTAGGDLGTNTYSDGVTPGVTNTFDRLGRLATAFRAGVTATLAYNDAGQQAIETYSGGPLNGLAVTNSYDGFLRRTNLSLLSSGVGLLSAGYSFDAASRLQTVSSGANSATYSYLANSPLVDHILFTNNGVFRMVRTNKYDFLNRLLVVSNSPAGGTALGYVYGYNAASQRTAMTNAAGERWDYGYDFLGQVTNGWKYDSSGYSNQSFAYLFDDIGNRNHTVSNGVNTGYVPNLLNQYTAVGAASPTYDADGNLLSDGRLQYGWDAENRLVAVTNGSVTLSLAYDWRGRRIQKIAATSGVGTSTNNFVYDGWNLIAVLSPQSSVLQSFTWGLDLSGSLQGAGGVGGLLMDENLQWGVTNFVAYDGNGNVMALLKDTDGSSSAQYEYGPFGELLRQTGPMARANPLRFSTKYQDDETDLLYYGYRYYSASTGRWLNRDPLEEKSKEMNLYRFVRNEPLDNYDLLGRNLGIPTCGYGCIPPPGGPPNQPPPEDDPPITTPPAPIMPISAPWQICCRPVKGNWLERQFMHCDLRQGPPDPGTKSTCYPVTRDPKCCNKNITSDLDMSKCFRRNPTTAGGNMCGGLWNNCQTSTMDALKACCGKTAWKPSWYGYPPNPPIMLAY